MDCHPVKASPPAGWFARLPCSQRYTNDILARHFSSLFFSCQKTCGRGPGARPETEDAMVSIKFNNATARLGRGGSTTLRDSSGFSDRFNFARWEQRMRKCSEKPCLAQKAHAMPCQRGETTACSRGAKPGPCHTHSQRKWQAGRRRQFSQPSHAGMVAGWKAAWIGPAAGSGMSLSLRDLCACA